LRSEKGARRRRVGQTVLRLSAPNREGYQHAVMSGRHDRSLRLPLDRRCKQDANS
jgi:hypothetical protein